MNQDEEEKEKYVLFTNVFDNCYLRVTLSSSIKVCSPGKAADGERESPLLHKLTMSSVHCEYFLSVFPVCSFV